MSRHYRGACPITYPPAAGAIETSLAPAPLRLMGWSLTPAITQAAEVQGVNPAPGAEFSFAVTGPCTIQSVVCTLTTAAVVASRFLHLQILDAAANVVADFPGSGAVVTSSSITAYWEQGLSTTSGATTGTAASAAPSMVIQAGWTIKIHVNAIQAGDQLSNIFLILAPLSSSGQVLVSITDGKQVVAQFDASQAELATFTMPRNGVEILSSLVVTVTGGTVTGVLWVALDILDFEAGGYQWRKSTMNSPSLSPPEPLPLTP